MKIYISDPQEMKWSRIGYWIFKPINFQCIYRLTAPEERQKIYWSMSCPIPKMKNIWKTTHFYYVLPVMGPKFQKTNSVRGVFILIQRNSLPEDVKGISMSPEDEFTLFFYIGIFSFLLQFYQYTPNLII